MPRIGQGFGFLPSSPSAGATAGTGGVAFRPPAPASQGFGFNFSQGGTGGNQPGTRPFGDIDVPNPFKREGGLDQVLQQLQQQRQNPATLFASSAEAITGGNRAQMRNFARDANRRRLGPGFLAQQALEQQFGESAQLGQAARGARLGASQFNSQLLGAIGQLMNERTGQNIQRSSLLTDFLTQFGLGLN